MSTLINGKHYKQVVIEYYDDLIAQVDAYAEERLKEIKDHEICESNETTENHEDHELFHDPDERFADPYSDHFSLDEESAVMSNSGVLLKDFVHIERMRAINEFKRLQKERLDELKLAETKPSSIDQALFGSTQFGFLVNIDKYSQIGKIMNLQLVAVVVDFYLDDFDVQKIE